jgi:DNA replication licensing factor MCM3
MNILSQVPTVSKDVEKLQLQEMVQDYMNQAEINKRMRNMLNSNNSKNIRFNVNMDELR